MLSICIPIYNYDCTGLINDLARQITNFSKEVEIILIDDASDLEFRKIIAPLADKVQLIQLTQNVGRSRIRNLLAEKACFENILFIDGDSSVIRSDFIKKYLEILKAGNSAKVICGGSIYTDQAPSKSQMLRWKYSKARERKSLSFSKKNPYQSFTTNNFIIDKEVFFQVKFDERIEEYGHEDTLFGYQLMQLKVSVLHVENVVLNGDIDSNEKYLKKTKESISNLLKIASLLNFNEDFIRLVPLLNVYFKIKLFGLEIFLGIWFRAFRKRLEKNFTKGKVNLKMFDLYRMGVLSFCFKQLKK